jgi:glycosyltransferase involved in cell wall biosynthesis
MAAASHLISVFIPSLGGGGAERVMASLAAGFTARGRQVEVVTCEPRGPFASMIPSELITTLPNRRMSALVPSLTRYLRTRQPTILLSAMKQCNVAAIAASAMGRCRTKVVVSEHSDVNASLRSMPRMKAMVLWSAMRATYHAASGLVAVSHGVRDSLVRAHIVKASSVNVIHNPIVDLRLKAAVLEPPTHPWCSDRSVPLVVSAGRLTKAKDYTTLLHAFAIVTHTRKARLLILGEGELRAPLMRLVTTLNLDASVAMPGFVDNPYSHMRAAAVFVLSSQWEGFGNVLVEAMASGAPVVSTDCPSGPAEILEHGRWGRLVPVGDSHALAGGIIDALESRVPVAFERADDFTADVATDRYLALFDRCTG